MHGSVDCAPARRSYFHADRVRSICGLFGTLLISTAAHGQTVTGSAELNATRSATASDSQSNGNSAVGQNYTVGWSSPVINPNLMRLNTELSFRRSNLTSSGSSQADETGRQHDLGFRVGTALFSSGTVPIVFEASRIRSNSSGDLGPSNPIRGSAFIPVGTLPLDFDTETSLLNFGARLNNERLPRVEVGYRTGASIVTGGPYRSEQQNGDLSASIAKDTQRVQQSFRFQRSSFDSQFPQAFSHRLGTLDYDFSSLLGSRFRLTAHAGQRDTLVRSAFEASIDEMGTAPYTPPASNGPVGMRFVSAGLNYDPTTRLSVRLFGIFDQQDAGNVGTNSLLTTLSTHYTVLRGLTLEASGTAGDRGQMLAGNEIRVLTRTGTVGATYRAGVRWLEGSVSTLRGFGTNTSYEGVRGSSDSWTREASLSSTIGWFGVGTGYERTSSHDQLLSLGNYESERVRASAQAQSARLTLSVAGDSLRIERGDLLTMATNVQRTFSGSASYRFWRQNLVTATAGSFSNEYWRANGPGRDDTLYWGLSTQATPLRALLMSAGIRSESARTTSTQLDQLGIGGYGRVEYRLRTLSMALEYRNNRSRIQYNTAIPDNYRGRQIRFSITRRFAFPG